jgi:hypothetical protein
MHEIVAIDLNNRHFPSTNYKEGEAQSTKGCQTSITSFLFTKNKINAYKNKYSTSGLKLSLTVSMVQNKSIKPTNTSIAFIDLDLHIYD